MADYDSGRDSSTSGVLMAFLAGAAIGAVAALLLAPQSGRESRDQIRRYARRTQDGLRDMAGKAGEGWEAAMKRGREIVEEQKTVLSEALEAGREAMRREQDRRPD
jgi:gas vesicle protein